jgi:hypothetical protein
MVSVKSFSAKLMTRASLLPLGVLATLLVCVVGLQAETQIARPIGSGWHAGAESFAIANLDGDEQPDLASVEMDRANGLATNYRIRVQLSAWPESAIGVVGPLGGLRISAADVNGDDQIDLVVRTTQKSTLIAVLLNDGNGHFRKAELANFPELEQEATIFLQRKSEARGTCGSVVPARGFRLGVVSEGRNLSTDRCQADISRNEGRRVLRRIFLCDAGRAPPMACRSI